MKKIVFFMAAIAVALPMRAQVLDTISWNHPQYYGYPENIPLDSVIRFGHAYEPFAVFQEYPLEYTVPVVWNTWNEQVYYGYTDSLLRVKGLAVVAHWDKYQYPAWGGVLDTSMTNCFEHLRLYKPRGGDSLELIEDGIFYADTPSHVMRIPYVDPMTRGDHTSPFIGFVLQDHLVYEVMFDKPINVTDSFYIGFTYYNSKCDYKDGVFIDYTWPVCYGITTLTFSCPYVLHNRYYRNNVYNAWHRFGGAMEFPAIYLIVSDDTTQVDDTVDICLPPDNLTYGYCDSLHNCVSLTWTDALGGEAYETTVVPWRDDPATGTVRASVVNNQTYGIDTLQTGIYYAAYVRTRCHHECDVHDTVYYSDWSDPLYFFLGDTEPTDNPYTSVNILAKTSEVTLVPNPANDQVTVICKDAVRNVMVFDMTGRCVLSQPSTKLDVSALPVGVYQVCILTSKGSTIKKLAIK